MVHHETTFVPTSSDFMIRELVEKRPEEIRIAQRQHIHAGNQRGNRAIATSLCEDGTTAMARPRANKGKRQEAMGSMQQRKT